MMLKEDSRPIRVVIADDHPVVRQGIRAYLESQSSIKVVGEAADGLEALERTRELSPHVLVADVTMPGLSGLEIARQLLYMAPKVKVLILSMHEDRAYLTEALRAGARGYLLKDSGPGDLLRAIESVHAGESFFTSGAARRLLGEVPPALPSRPRAGAPSLSPRERQVLSCLVDGMTSREIALQLSV
ncbi:MAG TPA: response regulator transcription factor, partial [Planctomycetota bacterium]|nr:response regulator transcription factor [Planctomycetota bacterium]